MKNIQKSIEACAAHYGDEAEAVREYLTQGNDSALKIPNRGPIKFDAHGRLDQSIMQAYSERRTNGILSLRIFLTSYMNHCPIICVFFSC